MASQPPNKDKSDIPTIEISMESPTSSSNPLGSKQKRRSGGTKRAKSFDTKLAQSAKARIYTAGEQGDTVGNRYNPLLIKRQHSEPAANKLDQLRKTLSSRTNSMKSTIKRTTADFFGVNRANEDECKTLWIEKRKRLLNRTLGPIKYEYTDHTQCELDTKDGFVEDLSITASPDADGACKKPVLQLAITGIHNVANSLKKSHSYREKDISLKSMKVRPSFTQIPSEDQDVVQKSQFVSLENQQLDHFLPLDGLDGLDGDFCPELSKAYESRRPSSRGPRARTKQEQNWHFLEEPHRIPLAILNNIRDNSDRRLYGMGIVGKLLNRKFRKNLTPEEKHHLNHMDDNRPYFTYWVTFVQLIILLISLFTHGFGPWGLTKVKISAHVFVTSLSIQQVDYFEPNNIWLGPRAADLIHLGAKYTPCMRKDKLIFSEIEKERVAEGETACCVRNYGGGCVQTTKEQCSPILSTWLKWDNNSTNKKNSISIPTILHYNEYGLPVSKLRISGTVCGQDPRYCQEPFSTFPRDWPDNISHWPICHSTKQTQKSEDKHMTCDLIGRPCCIGIHGECKIVTREYCDFVRGFFHKEATLCSQVSCMSDVCGMLQIKHDDNLFQIYRVWTSLFLHAGIFHMAITSIFQYYIMRDIEKLTGSFRIALIYMLSGIGGNLASSVFVPYRAEVGPGGSQFGLLACLIVEVLHNWHMLECPWKALSKLLLIATGLFIYGLLPWIDNYAHLFGFIIGFCISLALLPFITFLDDFRIKFKIIIICFCLFLVLLILTVLYVFLYHFPIYDCKYCSYFNCIPFTDDWCADHDIAIKRKDIL